MARNRLQSARDVDLLFLVREEEVYAGRVREALVFSESKLERPPAPLLALAQSIRDARHGQYVRPESLAENVEEEVVIIERPRRSKLKEVKKVEIPIPGPTAYTNPPINRRRTVEDNDALFSESGHGESKVMFTYQDLMATKEGRKVTTVRSLRRLANLWGINPKLNKAEMLSELIAEYARRFDDEVRAYESRKSTSRPRRRGKRHRR